MTSFEVPKLKRNIETPCTLFFKRKKKIEVVYPIKKNLAPRPATLIIIVSAVFVRMKFLIESHLLIVRCRVENDPVIPTILLFSFFFRFFFYTCVKFSVLAK